MGLVPFFLPTDSSFVGNSIRMDIRKAIMTPSNIYNSTLYDILSSHLHMFQPMVYLKTPQVISD